MNRDIKAINLFGGPGTGKSTTAAYLFHELKCAGANVELVTEYAKDMVWEQRTNILTDQVYIAAKQNRRMERLVDQGLDVVVTDSPLIMGCMYQPDDYFVHFEPLVAEIFKSYTNSLNIYLNRGFDYNPIGRYQTAEQASLIDQQIIQLLKRHDVPIHHSVNVGKEDWKHRLAQVVTEWVQNK